MKIFASHLLNDYSGSPKVLMQLVKGWTEHQHKVTIVTGKGRDGFLSGIKGAEYLHFQYSFASNPLIRLFKYFGSQLALMFLLLRRINKQDIVYVNTILPFGAAIAGRIRGCRVIYHLHETSVKPAILKKFLFTVARWTASEIIFVSAYLAGTEKFGRIPTRVLPNAIPRDFMDEAKHFANKPVTYKNVLMICSLKRYKGVDEFVMLAEKKPAYRFRLVVNASQNDIENYFLHRHLPPNLEVFPTQTNTHSFYQWADVVMNLSRPDEWVETFGLTAIEAMSYGLPVIVPPVGGIAEIVDEGFNGYHIDGRDTAYLSYKLGEMFEDKSLYADLRKAALYKAGYFDESTFIRKSLAILQEIPFEVSAIIKNTPKLVK
jgi:glycosyltransferase involved in cell wall biosynthesis